MRGHSSSTSSLSGAMGDAQISVQPRQSVTPPSGLASWTSSPTSTSMSGAPFMNVPDDMTYLTPVTPINSASPSGRLDRLDRTACPCIVPLTVPLGYPLRYIATSSHTSRGASPPRLPLLWSSRLPPRLLPRATATLLTARTKRSRDFTSAFVN